MFESLAGSIWGYPIIAAIHVLGLAWFGWTVLLGKNEAVLWKRIGISLMVLTGVLLFGMHAERYSSSLAFRTKMLLLVITFLFAARLPRAVSLILWSAIIFASRFTPFF